MKRTYDAKTLELKDLVGLKVLSGKITGNRQTVLLNTDKGNYILNWVGDCCANCFLANISGTDNLLDATITEAEDAEWVMRDEQEYEVIESMGTKLKTTKGHVTFESRVVHNGYYSGRIHISKDLPVDQYHCLEELPDDFVDLTDF